MNASEDIFTTAKNARERAKEGRFKVGDLIMNRYKILAELGQGGMGVVYKCFDETAGVEIALKTLPPELARNSYEMEEIRENFQLISTLGHQNIVISKNLEHDAANGSYYLIMECVKGEDLRRWIKRKHREGDLSLNDVLPIIRQVADALDYAHKHKIIHRDIKPANIILNEDGEAKILDFGLAAQIQSSMSRLSIGYQGTSGTGPYMAPEQWKGKVQKEPADQYALAVMTYEMLAGNLPFEGTDLAILQQAVLTQEADEIPGLPAAAQQALKRAMSKEPAERFSSCSDFVDALSGHRAEIASQPEPQQTQPTPAPEVQPESQEQPSINVLTLQKSKSYWHSLFTGRASLMQFWRYQLIWLMIFILTYIAAWFLIPDARGDYGLCLLFWSVAVFLLISAAPWNLSIAIKRLHDTGESGKNLYFLFLPGLGWLWLLFLLHRKQQEGKNKYGEQPEKLSLKSFIFPGCLTATIILLPWTRLVILIILVQWGLISELKIPYGIKTIESSAFRKCRSLKSITIPNSVTEIETWAFEGCSSLTNITIPNSVTKIGDWAFEGCSSLTSITIPNSVTKIGSGAFRECSSLTSITIPNSVTKIKYRAFYKCSSLTNITIPNSVTEIETWAFEGCSSLTNITIPNSVTEIGSNAFEGAGCEKYVKENYGHL